MDLLTASESKWILSRQLMVLTLRRTGRVDATRPKVFLSFFLEDKASAPDVFSSCSFIPCTQFESPLVDGQFCMVTRYDVISSGGQAIFEWKYFFFNFLNNKSNYYRIHIIHYNPCTLIGSCSVGILQYGPFPWKWSKTCIFVLEQK